METRLIPFGPHVNEVDSLGAAIERLNEHLLGMYGITPVWKDTVGHLPAVGVAGTIYAIRTTGDLYVWGGSSYSPHTIPTLARWDATSSAPLDFATGRAVPVVPHHPIGYDTVNPPKDLPWLSLRSPNEWEDLLIESPYSPGHILHPSICHIKESFAGYRYWMVYTPYPDADSSFENPCIAASNDLVEWHYPATNPIVGDPGGAYYNSDTDIYFDTVGNRLVVLFREVRGTVSYLKITTSTDGTVWSDPTTIYTSANFGLASATDIATPSIWFNDTSNRWEIIGLNAKDNASAWPVVKITSDALLSGWDSSATWTVLTAPPPTGRKWWNFQFRRLGGGAVVCLAQDNNGTAGVSGDLYALYSADGTTFAYRKLDTQTVKAWYRPTFLVMQDSGARDFSVLVIGSKVLESRLFVQTMKFDIETFALARAGSSAAVLAAASLGNVFGVYLADTFNRADDATGLGTSTSGHTYTQVSAAPSVIGISSNQAYPVNAAGNCQAYRDIGVTDCIAKFVVSLKTSGEMYHLLRYENTLTKIRVGCSAASQLKFQVVSGGVFDVNEDLGVTPVVGDEIKVCVIGNQFLIYLNDRMVAKRVSNQSPTSTLFGLGMSGASVKLDNYQLIRL